MQVRTTSSNLNGPVERIQTELRDAGDLGGQVPPVLEAEHDAAALEVDEVGDRPSHLEDLLQQQQPLAVLNHTQETLLAALIPLLNTNREVRLITNAYFARLHCIASRNS